MAKMPHFALKMDNVSIRTRLWIVVAVLAVPVVVLMATQFVSLQEKVDSAETEQAGVKFETEALELVRNLQLHRDHEMRVLRGNTASQASLDQTAKAVNDNFAELRELAGEAHVSSEVVRLQVDWEAFTAAKRATAIESFGAHTEFINAKAFPVLLTAATRSELFVDSELGSRSVIQALVASLNMGEQIAQARAFGYLTMVERAGQEATASEMATVAKYLSSAQLYSAELRFYLDLAVSAEPGWRETISPRMEKQAQALQTFSAFVTQNFVSAGVLESTRAESFHLLGTSAVSATNDLVTAAAGEMNSEFDSRASDARSDMRMVGGVALTGIAVAFLLAFIVARSITRPVSHLAEVADRISLGDLDVEIDVHGKNEVGQLAESLRRMQASLRSAIERLRQRRAA